MSPVIGARPEQLVSSDAHGVPANQDSGRPRFDASGQYVAFTSAATSISPLALPGVYSVYRKDRITGAVDLVSQGAEGTVANGDSQFPTICTHGQFVAFASTATNLLRRTPARLSGSYLSVYVSDEIAHQTTLVSVSSTGVPANAASIDPAFSADCSRISFTSDASNLVPGDHNGATDVFVRDLKTAKTTLVSVADDGAPLNGPSSNADIDRAGTAVAFASQASNLPDATGDRPGVYVRDLNNGRTVAVSAAFKGLGADVQGFAWPSFSPDGQYLVFRSLTYDLDSGGRHVLRGGRHVLVWDMRHDRSAITAADRKTPEGWNDACTSGINNGTRFTPVISDRTAAHPHLVLFTVPRNGVCNLVLRDLQGKDVPIRSEVNVQQVLEPTLNDTGDYLSWAIASQPQLIYACKITDCKG